MTPQEFRSQYDLSAGQFKRLKAKVAKSNPDAKLTIQNGNQWEITELGLELLAKAAQSRPVAAQSRPVAAQSRPVAAQSPGPVASPVAPSAFESALTIREPAQPLEIMQAEIVEEVAPLDIQLVDYSTVTDRAKLEIQNTAHIANGNRAMKRALRRKAMVEAARSEAIEDFALADKAYEATMAQLEQQQLNQLGIGQGAPVNQASAPNSAQVPAKK